MFSAGPCIPYTAHVHILPPFREHSTFHTVMVMTQGTSLMMEHTDDCLTCLTVKLPSQPSLTTLPSQPSPHNPPSQPFLTTLPSQSSLTIFPHNLPSQPSLTTLPHNPPSQPSLTTLPHNPSLTPLHSLFLL